MPRVTYVPNDTLLSFLKAQGNKTFKVTTIRDLFVESPFEERDSNELRRWVNVLNVNYLVRFASINLSG